jgi:ABC-type Na+ efflux pump permease subunit
MNESKHKPAVDKRRIVYFIFALATGIVAAVFGASWIHENSDARSVIATAFSVLAGFLVAVIAVQADERMIRGASWRSDFYRLQDVKRRLSRHRDTFQLYLLVLMLVFVLSLRIAMPHWLQNLLERGTLFLAVVAFILSFRIPEHLMRGYIEHLERCVEKERKG